MRCQGFHSFLHTLISKPKGSENYDSWKEEIQGILTLNKLWLVVIGKEKTPYPAKEVNSDKLLIMMTWEDKNAGAVAIIRLSCEPGPRVHIKGMEDAVAVWA